MSLVIHEGFATGGYIRIYEDGNYEFIEGPDPYDQSARYAIYQAGTGPPALQNMAERIAATYRLRNGLDHDRATDETRALADRLSPIRAVQGLPSEDQQAVPTHMRSGTSRFRADLRLQRGGESQREEELRRARAAAARTLAVRLARQHAHLQDLINREAHLPRFVTINMADSTSTPGRAPRRPTDLQLAIAGGFVVDPPTGHPYIADIQRGVNDDIIDRLAQELPGFGIQYEIAREREDRRITQGYLTDLVLSVIEIISILVTLGASAYLSLMRRSMQASMRRMAAAGAQRAVRPEATAGAGRQAAIQPARQQLGRARPRRARVNDGPGGRRRARQLRRRDRQARQQRRQQRRRRTQRDTPQNLTEPGARPSTADRGVAAETARLDAPAAAETPTLIGEGRYPRYRTRPRRRGRQGDQFGEELSSVGEMRNVDAMARRGNDVQNLPDTPQAWAALPARERRRLQALVRRARRQDRIPTGSTANPDHLIGGRIWDSKVMAPGSFNPRSVLQNINHSLGRNQSRRFIINVDEVVEGGVQVPVRNLIQRFRAFIRTERTPAQLRHGMFGPEVEEVVFVQNGRVFPVFSR